MLYLSSMENKREEPRAKVSFPVACDVLPQRSYFYTVCKDLSNSGIRLITNDFMPQGNSLKINLNLIDKVVNMRAKVMWCNKERYADRYYAGLKFIDIDEENRAYLGNFLSSTR